MKRSVELQAITLSLYESMSQGNVDSILSHITRQDGVLCVGTDAKEWWLGYDTLSRMFKVQFGEMGQVTFSDCHPEAYSEGPVGWAADRPTMNFTNGMKIPMRGTFVFHQEDGVWKMVQLHWSVGIGNEVFFGKELTTE